MIAANLTYTVILYFLYGLMFILMPAVVLYPMLKEHSLGYRILFYQIAGVAYVTLASFALVFLHFYNLISTWFCFVVVPIIARMLISRTELKESIIAYKEEYEERSLYEESLKSRSRRLKRLVLKAWGFVYEHYFRGRLLQYISAGIFVFLICWKFGYFHLTTYTYGCSDEPTHIYWIKSLMNGNGFPAGLYPHGLHFMVGELCCMFNLQPVRAYLCFTPVSISIIMLSAFLFIREIHGSGYAAAAGILVFILFDGIANMGWYYRLGLLMPMELSIFAVFVMGYGLVTWMKEGKRSSLVMAGLGIAGTTFIHVFATIIAFFVVVAFLIVYHNEMARKKVLHELIVCGVLSIFISVVPYIVGLSCGYQLEQSFSWGMSVVELDSSTEDTTASSVNSAATEEESGYSIETEEITGTISDASTGTIEDMLLAADGPEDYIALFNEMMTSPLVKTEVGGYVMIGCFLFCLLYGVLGFIIRRKTENGKQKYTAVIFASVSWLLLFGILYVLPSLNLFTIMAVSRSSVYIGLFSMVVYAAPMALVSDILEKVGLRRAISDRPFTTITCAAGLLSAFLFTNGLYENMYYTFTMENTDLETEQYLLDHADSSWTVISTTNARLGTVYDGYHYEITDLLLNVNNKDELYIPTKDIYVVVESGVPQMGSRMVDGSDYNEKVTEVSAECAANDILNYIIVRNGQISSKLYLTDAYRLGIMSHLYYWMEALKEVYPDSITIFMQDENCTVYHISQDEYFLLNLVVDYQDLAKEAMN